VEIAADGGAMTVALKVAREGGEGIGLMVAANSGRPLGPAAPSARPTDSTILKSTQTTGRKRRTS
jgi:hypothetical protein